MHLTIRFAGYGGYGVVTASRVLGLTFTQKGFHVLQTESHGAAARGGACTADLSISSDPIHELGFVKPDILIVLSTPAFKKCCSISPDLSSDLLLLEAEIIPNTAVQLGLADLLENNGTQIYQAEIRKLAEKLGNVRYMGIASLGALAAIDGRIDITLLKQTIKTDDKLRRFEKNNIKALQGGANAVTPYRT
ncbi:MAG: 2-oxoacid:acceptor oxidoreductase family protein [Candidatus Thorarchaeota archaeon]